MFFPKGLWEYSLAHFRMVHWIPDYYVPGRRTDDKAAILANNPEVLNTIELLKQSIAKRAEPIIVHSLTKSYPIDEDRRAYDGTNYIKCPHCGISSKISVRYGDESGHGLCSLCGKAFAVKVMNGNIYITGLGMKIKMVPLTHKIDMATANSELGFLYRMMNRFSDAQDAYSKAENILDELIQNEPENKEILTSKSLLTFRKGELAHIQNNFTEAKHFYQESLDLDHSIGNHGDDELVNRLIGELA